MPLYIIARWAVFSEVLSSRPRVPRSSYLCTVYMPLGKRRERRTSQCRVRDEIVFVFLVKRIKMYLRINMCSQMGFGGILRRFDRFELRTDRSWTGRFTCTLNYSWNAVIDNNDVSISFREKIRTRYFNWRYDLPIIRPTTVPANSIWILKPYDNSG